MAHWVPELLSPAGSLEKAKVALEYGADAVYLAGQKFGLRTAADNFTPVELDEVVTLAHSRGRLVYVVLNSFFHDGDLLELPEFLGLLEELKIDALIVSDLGVMKTIQRHSKRPIHLSTQASCLNSASAKFWAAQGVTRLVLGRETSLQEAREIKAKSGLEIEMFIHGSLCMAYSGNCVISNYTQGRDSNRGGCAHSCRFDYSLDFSPMGVNKTDRSFFMSSKDLEGIALLPEFIKAGVDSLKVEGRMKSPHYAGTVSKVYSEALAFFKAHGTDQEVLRSVQYLEQVHSWQSELRKLVHRETTTASLVERPDQNSIYAKRDEAEHEVKIAAQVLEVLAPDELIVEVRSAFSPESPLELVPFQGATRPMRPASVKDMMGRDVSRTKPGMLVRIPWVEGAQERNLVRLWSGEVAQ